MKYLGAVDPPNISGDGAGEIPLTRMDWRKRYDPEQSVGKSNTNRGAFILEVYSPQIFDGTTSVKYFGGLQPPNI